MADGMKVMLGFPNTGYLHIEVVKTIVRIINENDGSFTFRFVAPTVKCNENNYQTIAKEFWETDCEYLVQIDSDNPPVYNPVEVCKLGLDIVGLPTPTWKWVKQDEDFNPLQWNAYKRLPSGRYEAYPPAQGLQEVDAVGAGTIVIHRRVFQAPLMQREGWHRRWNPKDGIADQGLDLAFCERAKKCGFKVYTHWDYPCRHFNEVDLATVSDGFKQWARVLGLESKENSNILATPEEIAREWATAAPPLARASQ